MTDSALVVVRTFLNNFEAEIARSVLEAAEIDSMIRADDCNGVEPGLWMGGVALLVAAEDAARAAEILDSSAGLPAGAGDPAAE